MNLQQLEYILAVHKYKSFSKAADSCHITQATLSIMVKKLEEELEVMVFDRKSNPVLTTELGMKIVAEAQSILAHTGRLKQLASEFKGTVKGELKLGIIPTVAGNLLPKIIPSILEKYPEVKLSIQEITTGNILSKLKTGELDAGIVSTPLDQPQMEEWILYYEKLLVYGHSLSTIDRYQSPTEIIHEKVWLLEEGHCLTDQIINVCALSTKKIHPNLNFNPSSFESLLNIVDSLKGLTLIPELYYVDLSAEKQQFVKDFMPPYPVREISLIYYRPYAKQNLISVMAEEIRQIVQPLLMTSRLKPSEMMIAGM